MNAKIILKIHPQQKQAILFHRVFSMSTISSFRSIENKHDVYRGNYCMNIFCEFLREHAMKIINTVLSPIRGHRWCKDICPRIRGVRFLESLTILVLFSIFFFFAILVLGIVKVNGRRKGHFRQRYKKEICKITTTWSVLMKYQLVKK